ncbi:hypothetical protein D3C78_1996890 [compost metagenome]
MKAHKPPLKLPAMPSADKVCPAFNRKIRALAAAAPNTPQVAVECQPAPLWAE